MVKNELLPALLWVGPLHPSTVTLFFITSLFVFSHLSYTPLCLHFSPLYAQPGYFSVIKPWRGLIRQGWCLRLTWHACRVTLILFSCLYNCFYFEVWNKIPLGKMLLEYSTSTLKALSGNSTAIPTRLYCSNDRSALPQTVSWAWMGVLAKRRTCLENFHVYCTLFNVDGNISACLYVGVTQAFSDCWRQGSELQIKSNSSTEGY